MELEDKRVSGLNLVCYLVNGEHMGHSRNATLALVGTSRLHFAGSPLESFCRILQSGRTSRHSGFDILGALFSNRSSALKSNNAPRKGLFDPTTSCCCFTQERERMHQIEKVGAL